jgi:hypothetical protein
MKTPGLEIEADVLLETGRRSMILGTRLARTKNGTHRS